MNFFKKIFGGKTSSSRSIPIQASQAGSINSINDQATKLWELIDETLTYYDSISCQCAFPRFRQYTSIDTLEHEGLFYMSETEGFIHHCKPYFDIQEVDKDHEHYRAIYTCKKCGSTYDFAWSDFSIVVDRSFLKLRELKVPEIGASEKNPIPFFVGLFGPALPAGTLFERVDFETFKDYIRETKDN